MCSFAIDQKTKEKVAIKKLYRPFQSLIHAKRAYRELRLLRHIQHDNVSLKFKEECNKPRVELDVVCSCIINIVTVFSYYALCDSLINYECLFLIQTNSFNTCFVYMCFFKAS